MLCILLSLWIILLSYGLICHNNDTNEAIQIAADLCYKCNIQKMWLSRPIIEISGFGKRTADVSTSLLCIL